MDEDFGLLSLLSPTGNGQENQPDDVEALDDALRKIDAYRPPAEYSSGPQRYATEPLIGAIERFQEQNGLKVDGYANPGGPTERAINNRILKKPRGAGLLFELPAPIRSTVGNGFKNERADVASVQRRLGALDYLPEDPFDRPHGFIDEPTTEAVKRFQTNKGLTADGWLAPGGQTERALDDAVSDVARAQRRDWFAFAERAGRAQKGLLTNLGYRTTDGSTDAELSGDEAEAAVIPAFSQLPRPNQSPTLPGAPQRPPFGGPRGLLEIHPRFQPQRIPNTRNPPPLPRDLEIVDPAARPLPPIRRSTPERLPPRNWEPPTIADIDRALRPEPMPDPTTTVAYLPEPGSVLGIPITSYNQYGRYGDPRTVDANRTLAKAIEEGCKSVMEGANIHHYSGPLSPDGKERIVGRSFPDSETRIEYKGVTIRIFGDTYTPKGDRTPNSREQAQYAKLDRNAEKDNRIHVRLPKPWQIGEEIDPKKLTEFTKELCREVKKAVDEGKIGDGKDKLALEKFFEELTKKKKPGSPKAD